MSVTITVLIFFSVILLAFLQEFTHFFKKAGHITGIMVVGPLITASYIIVVYEDLLHDLFVTCQVELHRIVIQLALILPFKTAALNCVVFVGLFLLGCMPAWLIWCASKISGRKSHYLQSYRYYFGVVFWVMGFFLTYVYV